VGPIGEDAQGKVTLSVTFLDDNVTISPVNNFLINLMYLKTNMLLPVGSVGK
jgi:hypothetical protein